MRLYCPLDDPLTDGLSVSPAGTVYQKVRKLLPRLGASQQNMLGSYAIPEGMPQ